MNREELFTQYYTKYYNKAFGYILKRVVNHQTAEDMTMEVFAKCYEHFDSFDESKASFATWMFVIVNNQLKNYYRDKREFDEIEEGHAVDAGFEDDIVQAQYVSQMRAVLKDALNELNEVQRSIVIMKYFKEKNSNDIALEMGMTPGNVRVQLSRAMNVIRDYFKKKNIDVEL